MLDHLKAHFLRTPILAGVVALSLAPSFGCAGPRRGILIMAHGGEPEWNEDVEAVVAPLRSKYPTEIAFGMAQTSSIREAVRRLEAQGCHDIAVVRMFVSGDSFVPSTEYILGLRDTPPLDPLASRGYEHAKPESITQPGTTSASFASSHGGNPSGHAERGRPAESHGGHCMEAPERISSRSRFRMSYKGIGESPLIDEILHDRVSSLSTDPRQESVLILAHGPADDRENEKWMANMNQRVQQLAGPSGFRAVRCETLREDWPDRREQAERRIREFVQSAARDNGRCLVIPFRVAGFGPYEEVLAGLNYQADGRGFCPHPNMTRWIEETARECWD